MMAKEDTQPSPGGWWNEYQGHWLHLSIPSPPVPYGQQQL
jgi:hypothetical protein